MKLISATPSPYARKVRIALAEKGLDFELLTEVPWNQDTTVPQHNPLEKLPVLLLDDGTTVYDSSYILEFLERRYPIPPLLPADDDGILAAKKLDVLANGICDAVILVFFERLRPEAHRSQPWIRKVHAGVAEVARLIGDRRYAVGDAFGLGDIAAVSALGYLEVRFKAFDWRGQYPSLSRYMDGLMQRKSLRETVPYPQAISSAVV
jgi:glutathione S-transferase